MLTLRKRLFIENYKTCKSATEAAKLAGYSPKSAHAQGCQLLKDVDIAKAIKNWEEEELAKPRRIREQITQEVYEKTAWERQQNLAKPDLQYKYFELYGKSRRFIGNDNESTSNVSIFAILAKELGGLLTPPKSKKSEIDIQPIVDLPQDTINSVGSEGTNLTEQTLSDIRVSDFRNTDPSHHKIEQAHDTHDQSARLTADAVPCERNKSGAGMGGGNPPTPPQNIYVNPQDKSPTTLNPPINSINTEEKK